MEKEAVRRKLQYDPYSEEENEVGGKRFAAARPEEETNPVIPKSLKIGIQLMLLNLRHNKDVSVHSIPRVYQTLYGIKINPKLYGFSSIETMMLSPEMKAFVTITSTKSSLIAKAVPLWMADRHTSDVFNRPKSSGTSLSTPNNLFNFARPAEPESQVSSSNVLSFTKPSEPEIPVSNQDIGQETIVSSSTSPLSKNKTNPTFGSFSSAENRRTQSQSSVGDTAVSFKNIWEQIKAKTADKIPSFKEKVEVPVPIAGKVKEDKIPFVDRNAPPPVQVFGELDSKSMLVFGPQPENEENVLLQIKEYLVEKPQNCLRGPKLNYLQKSFARIPAPVKGKPTPSPSLYKTPPQSPKEVPKVYSIHMQPYSFGAVSDPRNFSRLTNFSSITANTPTLNATEATDIQTDDKTPAPSSSIKEVENQPVSGKEHSTETRKPTLVTKSQSQWIRVGENKDLEYPSHPANLHTTTTTKHKQFPIRISFSPSFPNGKQSSSKHGIKLSTTRNSKAESKDEDNCADGDPENGNKVVSENKLPSHVVEEEIDLVVKSKTPPLGQKTEKRASEFPASSPAALQNVVNGQEHHTVIDEGKDSSPSKIDCVGKAVKKDSDQKVAVKGSSNFDLPSGNIKSQVSKASPKPSNRGFSRPTLKSKLLSELLDGRTIMHRDSKGHYFSPIGFCPFFLSTYVHADFNAMKSRLQGVGGFHLEQIQTSLYKKLRHRFPLDSCFFYHTAIKMAEVDHITDYQCTEPKNLKTGSSLILPDEPLYFCDLAGGPGGCVEYMLWKKKWGAKGWGLSKWSNEYNYNLNASPVVLPECFEPYYGNKGIRPEYEGSFFSHEVVEGFIDKVMKGSEDRGVLLVTTIGSNNSLRISKDNENVWKPVLLTQIYIALSVLRQGGTLVLKMFDAKTNYTASLVYMLFKSFDEISFKRPATFTMGSSERTLICVGRKDPTETDVYVNFLADCHKHICHWKCSASRSENQKKYDILIPNFILTESQDFIKFLKDANDANKLQQIAEIRKLMSYFSSCRDRVSKFVEDKMDSIKDMMLSVWKLEDRSTAAVKTILENHKDLLKRIGIPRLNDMNFEKRLGNFEEVVQKLGVDPTKTWSFVHISNPRCLRIFLGLGDGCLMQYDGSGTDKLISLRTLFPDEHFVISKDTVVLGEIVRLHDKKAQKSGGKCVFYIVDAMILGGKDIRGVPYDLRVGVIEKFVKAMKQHCNPKPSYVEIKVQKALPMTQLPVFLKSLEEREKTSFRLGVSEVSELEMQVEKDKDERCFIEAILFLEKDRQPYKCSVTSFIETVAEAKLWKLSLTELKILGWQYSENRICDTIVNQGFL